MGYQFFLPMVLRWHALRAEAPLKILKLQSGIDIRTKFLCLALTLVNARNNVNKTSKDVSAEQLQPSSFFLKANLVMAL